MILKKIYLNGYENYYAGSNGIIYRNCKCGMRKLKTFHRNKNDRQKAVVLISDKRKNLPVRFLVLLAFKGYRPPEFECKSINGIKADTRIKNLKWQVRKNTSMFEILDKEEFKLFEAKLLQIKIANKCVNYQSECLKKYNQIQCNCRCEEEFKEYKKHFFRKLLELK